MSKIEAENITRTLLQEFREFRVENNRRWDENEKRWKENNERWKQNDESIAELKEGRKQDRREIIDILDTMQESISEQFLETRKYMDLHFNKILTAQMANDIDHIEFRKNNVLLNNRVKLQNSRIDYLEKWKQDLENGSFFAV